LKYFKKEQILKKEVESQCLTVYLTRAGAFLMSWASRIYEYFTIYLSTYSKFKRSICP